MRFVRLVGLVASPPEISEPAEVESEIRNWEGHQRTLTKEFRESLVDRMKAGIMGQMLPKKAQDFVPHTFGNQVRSDDIVERVRTFVAKKVAMTSFVHHSMRTPDSASSS